MNNTLRKGIFKLTEDGIPVEGFTDDSTWNGWSKPIFTSENLKKVFHPYTIRFEFTADCIPCAILNDKELDFEIVESFIIWDGEQFLIGYAPQGFCFLECEK